MVGTCLLVTRNSGLSDLHENYGVTQVRLFGSYNWSPKLDGKLPSLTYIVVCRGFFYDRDVIGDCPYMVQASINKMDSLQREGPILPRRLSILEVRGNNITTTSRTHTHIGGLRSKVATILPTPLRYLDISINDVSLVRIHNCVRNLKSTECYYMGRVKTTEGIISIKGMYVYSIVSIRNKSVRVMRYIRDSCVLVFGEDIIWGSTLCY